MNAVSGSGQSSSSRHTFAPITKSSTGLVVGSSAPVASRPASQREIVPERSIPSVEARRP